MIMKLELVVRKDVSHVELVKDERYPLGVTVRDGTNDEAGPVIKRIKSKSLAERSYAVAQGDVILSLNGREVMGAMGKDVQWMLKDIGPSIDLKLQYEIREACISRSGVYRKNKMTTKLQKVDDSFGFVLRKNSRHPSAAEYPLISNIQPGSPAYKDGSMQDGDRLLKVDEVNLSCMSLADIANLLQERTEAEFTFEYNIRVLDCPKPDERKIDLMIDVPHMDLGIGICTIPMASREMCIGSIRQGSVAERCGIFCKGDIILSVNGVDVEFLTVSKANSLLRYTRKNRRICFVSTRGRDLNSVTVPRKLCAVKVKSAVTSSSSIGIQAIDNKHLNTPASSNSTVGTAGKNQTPVCAKEQVKMINIFQDVVKHVTGLKQCLSQLTLEAFNGNNHTNIPNEMCTSCNKTQYSIKLCVSCLAKMNVKCAHSMDDVKNLIAHFVAVSIGSKTLHIAEDSRKPLNDIYENPSESGVARNLIYSLTKTLPNLFVSKPELKKSFKDLAEKIYNADISCVFCKNDINFVSVTVQKLLLLISLDVRTTEIKSLINELARLLIEAKFACDEDERSSQSSVGNKCTSETLCSDPPSLSSMDGASSSKTTSVLPQNIVEPQLDECESDYENSKNDSSDQNSVVNLTKESAYYRISNIQQSSESLNELNAINLDDGTPLVNDKISLSKENVFENSAVYLNSEVASKNKNIYKDKNILPTRPKLWKSLDSILNRKNYPEVYSTANRNESNNTNCSDNRNTDGRNPVTEEVSIANTQQHSSAAQDSNHPPRSNKRKDSKSNTGSEASSFKDLTKNGRSIASNKIRKETVDVKMVNDGRGFGFSLGFSSANFKQTLPVPIITAIKPKSPAEKVGILQKKDRVLAINHKSLVNMPLKELENLKRRVFVSEQVVLTIEFDVTDVPIRLGTFDIVLQKGLRPGIVFDDMKKGYPMVVAGIEKGSAAYRSGQLFPGDKLTFLSSVRKEEYDPVTCSLKKEETVTITVLRDPNEGVKESSTKSLSSHSNPLSFIPRQVPQSGMNFIIQRTSVRPVEGSESLLFEQEVTLFRDPITWDFGFLVGENPETGRAYVTDVRPGGPANASGVVKRFDRIVEVNGVPVGKSEERSVLSLLTQANDKVDLLIRRLYHEEMNNLTLKASRF